jgi:hypothetical protein
MDKIEKQNQNKIYIAIKILRINILDCVLMFLLADTKVEVLEV